MFGQLYTPLNKFYVPNSKVQCLIITLFFNTRNIYFVGGETITEVKQRNSAIRVKSMGSNKKSQSLAYIYCIQMHLVLKYDNIYYYTSLFPLLIEFVYVMIKLNGSFNTFI